jgi:hypothetical protein
MLSPGIRLLILVSKDHPSYENTFLPIIKSQKPCGPPVTIDKDLFCQIEALVHANISRDNVSGGRLSVSEFVKYFSLVQCDTIQVWGKIPQRRFRDFLRSRSESSRNSMYRRLLQELRGDRSSTLELVNIIATLSGDISPAEAIPAVSIGCAVDSPLKGTINDP